MMSNKFIINLFNSINGLKLALKEHSFVAEVLGGIIFIPYVLFSDLALIFKLILITVYFLLLAFELVNTAIEELCNKITLEIDADIKKIKDISSASVFIILITLIILIFYSFLCK
jgi:diacylglycerol kinase (ATP)